MKDALTKLGAAVAYLLIFTSFVENAHASFSQPVPEVDSGSMAAAVALLIGGYLVAVSKFHKK